MIKFNEVTWYSKLSAIIFFIGILPALTFYIGTQYQLSIETEQINVNVMKTSPVSSGVSYIQKVSCHDSPNHFIITHMLEDIGEAILVKDKSSVDQKFDCTYSVGKNDFEIKNEAEYFKAVEGNFLITDAGTGPTPRGLQIYDLISKKSVFKDTYSSPIEIKNGTITYWKPVSEKVTKDNCPKLNEYTASGLGSGIESHTILSLSNLNQKDLGEKRCSPRQ